MLSPGFDFGNFDAIDLGAFLDLGFCGLRCFGPLFGCLESAGKGRETQNWNFF